MDEAEKSRLREHLIELRKFVGKQNRHFAFRTYSRSFLVEWLAKVSKEFGVEIPLLNRMVMSLDVTATAPVQARVENSGRGG